MGGGSNGKGGEGGARFALQCEGLQGLWAETDKKTKRWIVDGAKAHRQIRTGTSPSSYTLCEGDDGGLVWGIKGQYVLDSHFKPGSSLALWLRPGTGGEVAFSWEYQGPVPEDFHETRAKGRGKGKDNGDDKGKGGGKGGKSKGKSYGKASPADHWSWHEWWDSGAPWYYDHQEEEKRIDPEDGEAYTWEELKAFYSGKCGYSPAATKAYWSWLALATPYQVEPERRIDIADGKAYSWEELRAFYSAEFTTRAMQAYWAELSPADAKVHGKAAAKGKDGHKGKDAARGKAKGKNQGQGSIQGLQ